MHVGLYQPWCGRKVNSYGDNEREKKHSKMHCKMAVYPGSSFKPINTRAVIACRAARHGKLPSKDSPYKTTSCFEATYQSVIKSASLGGTKISSGRAKPTQSSPQFALPGGHQGQPRPGARFRGRRYLPRPNRRDCGRGLWSPTRRAHVSDQGCSRDDRVQA